jgi:hypothetical protein
MEVVFTQFSRDATPEGTGKFTGNIIESTFFTVNWPRNMEADSKRYEPIRCATGTGYLQARKREILLGSRENPYGSKMRG